MDLKDFKGRILIVGIGNTLKGDDGAGCEVIRCLKIVIASDQRERGNLEKINLLDCGTAPENYTKKIKDFKPETIVFIDAVEMKETPGTVKIIDEKDISSGFFTTHNMPLNLFLGYIKEETKANIIFIGIQPKSTRIGECLSAPVQKAVEKLVNEFSDELED
ncbi:MAG: hydrogenase maturation peptidase HycI [Elusimicrobia bacterium]|nr:hydrogenase maturation peptidase HycI [Elusimicrobiota bacterium]